MSELFPPRGSQAEKNLVEAGREKIIATAYMRHKIEELAKKLVNLYHQGKKFNELNNINQEKLRIKAAEMLNRMNGGKRRKTRHTRRRTHRKRRHTSLKRK